MTGVGALLRACHPLPSVAVTAFTGAYALASGAAPGRAGALAVPVLLGQLAVGWTNDAVDAPLDRAAGRTDKPLAGTGLGTRTVVVAAVAAGTGCVVLSLLVLGPLAGGLHLVAVGAALGYDLRLKGIVASPLPYVVAFGLLPVVASLGGVDAAPPLAHVAAAALLGAAAHLTNTVGDVGADTLTGVRGLPQRWGPVASVRVGAGLVVLAAGVLLGGLASGPADGARTPAAAVLLLAAATLALVPALRPAPQEGSRQAFRTTLAAVALVLLGLLLGA